MNGRLADLADVTTAARERYIAFLRAELGQIPVYHPLATEYRDQLAELVLSGER